MSPEPASAPTREPADLPPPRRAIILGGGLAGIAAAIRLHDAGLEVRLLEARDRLGGRAGSFRDPATGDAIDNCQHVLLGCCTNLLAFYRRLGVLDRIRWFDSLHFAWRDAADHGSVGRADDSAPRFAVQAFRPASRLPAPLHLVPPFLALRAFGPGDKTRLALGMRDLLAADIERLEPDLTFGAWLRRREQPNHLVERYWNVIIRSACNLAADRVAARHAVQVFQQGFLAHGDAWRMGLSTVPLVDLYDEAARHLDDVRFRRRVTAIEIDEDARRITAIRTQDGDRETISADTVVVGALPPEAWPRLADETARTLDPRLALGPALGHSAIIGVHLAFERPLDHLPPHVAFLDGATCDWFFVHEGGHRLHAVVSAADDLATRPASMILERVLGDLAGLPGVGRAGLERARLARHHVIKERRATFAATPEAERRRPTARGAIRNLVLAGDTCRSGWPATMEGAVRTGCIAAATALGRHPDADLEPDLPAAPLYHIARAIAAATP